MPLAGDFVRAADLAPGVGIGIPAYITKGANETVTSSTTLQDDDQLQFTMEPGVRYLVEFNLSVQSASGTPDFKSAWSGPADITGIKYAMGPAVATSAGWVGRDDTNMRTSAHGVTTTISYAMDTAGSAIREYGWVESATGGTLKLQWAQNTSNATATQMNSQSWLTYMPIEA